METQEFYKTIINEYLEDSTKNDIIKGLLTAKEARKMTNDSIINKIKVNILNDIKVVAKEGRDNFCTRINKKFDYNFALNFLTQTLKYKVKTYKEDSDYIYININW